MKPLKQFKLYAYLEAFHLLKKIFQSYMPLYNPFHKNTQPNILPSNILNQQFTTSQIQSIQTHLSFKLKQHSKH